jgi:anthranilate synthase
VLKEEYFKYNENREFRKITKSIEYSSFDSFFDGVRNIGIILESVEIAPIYGRLSLIVIDPPVQVIGKDNKFEIIALNKHGEEILKLLDSELFKYAHDLKIRSNSITGYIERENELLDESKRIKQKNISYIIRDLIGFFSCNERFLGLYGAFSYDFVRLFEDIPDLHEDEGTPDFNLFLPDFIVYSDHLKERADIFLYDFYRFDVKPETYFNQRYSEIEYTSTKQRNHGKTQKQDGGNKNLMTQKDYEMMVDRAKEEIRRGEIFEIVLSHSRYFKFNGEPIDVYKKFRTINPSPYLFYVNFGEDCLIGASPEMFLRIEDSLVQTRPISGTVKRGENAIDDYFNMMDLLNSEKEKAELDMLIDLARNDIARVCKPGVEVKDYRFVEKYSKVMHTVAHVEGTLDTENFEPFDAFIVSLNAGTLTGAPKVAAMNLIERFERSRRGYYGGNAGYITFSGNLDFGIIIRTAYIKDNIAEVRVGATLLYDSKPEKEYIETMDKGSAFFEILEDMGSEDV